jgi:hypothetical protein
MEIFPALWASGKEVCSTTQGKQSIILVNITSFSGFTGYGELGVKGRREISMKGISMKGISMKQVLRGSIGTVAIALLSTTSAIASPLTQPLAESSDVASELATVQHGTPDLDLWGRGLFVEPFPELPTLTNPDDFLPTTSPSRGLHLVIDLSDRQVYVLQGDQLHASFPIAVGRAGWETPVGQHEVIQMIRDPAWENPFTGDVIPPGIDNPLGVRWIGFWTDGDNYIGFHGTPNEASVGTAASHGCIRMYNRDVVQLFEMVAIGTPVIVEP